MKQKVKVTANEAGQVINVSPNNPEYGYIRVEQSRAVINENTGFLEVKSLSALIQGKVEDLKKLNLTAGQEIEGNVIFKEQLVPFNKKDGVRDIKVAGETGIVCKVNGNPIYRKNFYSPSNESTDVYIRDNAGNIITHDNVEEIRAAYVPAPNSGSGLGRM